MSWVETVVIYRRRFSSILFFTYVGNEPSQLHTPIASSQFQQGSRPTNKEGGRFVFFTSLTTPISNITGHSGDYSQSEQIPFLRNVHGTDAAIVDNECDDTGRYFRWAMTIDRESNSCDFSEQIVRCPSF